MLCAAHTYLIKVQSLKTMPCLLHTSGGRDKIVAMVWDRAGLDVGGEVAGEYQLLRPWFDQFLPFFTAVSSEEEVVSIKLWAATGRKAVRMGEAAQVMGDGQLLPVLCRHSGGNYHAGTDGRDPSHHWTKVLCQNRRGFLLKKYKTQHRCHLQSQTQPNQHKKLLNFPGDMNQHQQFIT